MRNLKNLFLLLTLLMCVSCKGEEKLDVVSANLCPEFTVEATDAQVTVNFKNPDMYAYDVYASKDGKTFLTRGTTIRKNVFVDNVSQLGSDLSLTYRVIPTGGNVYSPEAIQKQKMIKINMSTNDELLDIVEKQTLKYFYDFAHPTCKLARERSNIPADLDVVTTGGTGFGIMALVAGAERGFITRQQAYSHIRDIVNFLQRVERFHGAYAHWYYGNTGQVKPFSDKDNGGDLVETAFLMQGLLTARQYFAQTTAEETKLVADITSIWESVEWNWYTQGQKKLFWHWSKQYGFQMNMPIGGWNEGLIVYVLAASSPTHSISADVYDEGWAHNGAIKNGNTYYGIKLPAGPDSEKGGPLFFSHYSFLGLDPTGLSDKYISSYFEQCKNHTLINRAYCIENPKNFPEYGENLWGLTASDCPVAPWNYLAHAPGGNDNGTISPTAALSSMPYTPVESMKVLKYLYREKGELVWGDYGFYDAYNPSAIGKQVYKSYLAIDQGPIVVMIENYRSGLLWKNFMKNQDVKNGLKKLNFTSSKYQL